MTGLRGLGGLEIREGEVEKGGLEGGRDFRSQILESGSQCMLYSQLVKCVHIH